MGSGALVVPPGGGTPVAGPVGGLQDPGDQSARILVRFTPAGMERFFEDHAELPPGPVDLDVYRAIARSNWMELAGPPLAESHPF